MINRSFLLSNKIYTYQNIYSILLISFQNDEQTDLQMEININSTPSSSIQTAEHADIVKSSGFVKQVGCLDESIFFHFLKIINQNGKYLNFHFLKKRYFFQKISLCNCTIRAKLCFKLSIFITLRCYLITKCIQNYAD